MTQNAIEIVKALDQLAPGAGLVLEEGAYPRAALGALQTERAGRFEWNVLEAGPERYRVEIRARSSGPRAVTEYLQTDHERLDAIVGEVFEAIESDALREAKQRFSDFACGLRRHIVAEEQVLFPAFEEVTGMTRGPTTVMRMEHERIEELLRAIESALDAGDASAAATLETLVGILSDHNQKEEHVLYPTTDRLLGEKGREALVLRMQSL